MSVTFKAFRLNHICSAVLVVTAIGAAGDALAQQPRQDQLNALRSSCRGDYMAHCSSVPTGGAPALNCLKQHMSALSSACQSAVNALSPTAPAVAAAPAGPTANTPPSSPPSSPPGTPPTRPPGSSTGAPAAAPAAPPPTMQAAPAAGRKAQRQEAVNIRRACATDYHTHCAGIPLGKSAACLKRNAATLSRGCLQALVAAPAVATARVAAPAAAPAPAPVPAAAPPVEPAPLLVTRREELFIIRGACGADFAMYCRGLRPGLGRIAACLHYNKSNLSPRCQQAIVALHEGR